VIADPPSVAGADQRTVALPSPAVGVPMVGAPGTVGGGGGGGGGVVPAPSRTNRATDGTPSSLSRNSM